MKASGLDDLIEQAVVWIEDKDPAKRHRKRGQEKLNQKPNSNHLPPGRSLRAMSQAIPIAMGRAMAWRVIESNSVLFTAVRRPRSLKIAAQPSSPKRAASPGLRNIETLSDNQE